MLINHQVPGDYFITTGEGHSQYSHKEGSDHQALHRAGIGACHLLECSALIAGGAKEVQRPSLIMGQSVQTIMAKVRCNSGETATAGILVAELIDTRSGLVQSSLVCKESGLMTKEEMEPILQKHLMEIHKIGYAKYKIGATKLYFHQITGAKTYGTALVAICFTNYHLMPSHKRGKIAPFLGKNIEIENAKAIVQPVLFADSHMDQDKLAGPASILEASTQIKDYHIETGTMLLEYGVRTEDLIGNTDSSRELLKQLERKFLEIDRAGKFPIFLGGEQTLSIGTIRGAKQRHEDLSVLYIDKNADFQNIYEGNKFQSECVLKRISEMCDDYILVGVNELDPEEAKRIDYEKCYFSCDIDRKGIWITDLVEDLSEKVYISLDLGVIISQINGMDPRDLIELIKEVARQKQIIGIDFVGFKADPLHSEGAQIAARLVYEVTSHIVNCRKQ